MALFRRVYMIIQIVFFLLLALGLSWFAHALSLHPRRDAVPGWLVTGRGVLWSGFVLAIVIPFYLERVFTGIAAPDLRRRGKEPGEVVLLTALAIGGGWPILAFVLFVYGGNLLEVYATSAAAIVTVLFWTWRCRGVLKPQLGTGKRRSSSEEAA